MKRLYMLLLSVVVLGIISGTVLVSQHLPTVQSKDSDVSSNQKTVLDFVEHVLPIDSSQYNITLIPPNLPPESGVTENAEEILTYKLESNGNILNLMCQTKNGVITYCNLDNVNGSVVSDYQYGSITQAAVAFLQKYQEFSGLNSTLLIDLLSGVDPAQNTTILSGNLKLEVKHSDLTGTAFGDSVSFRWMQSFNGCDYRFITLGFRDGFFSMIGDDRQVYSIGDTSVNTSKEQAVTIALNAVKTYSYRISDNWVVDEFDVLKNQITAVLIAQHKGDNVLLPAWSVTLPLNGTWPGSVTELLVIIWAGTGEVELVHHQAYAQLYPKTPVYT